MIILSLLDRLIVRLARLSLFLAGVAVIVLMLLGAIDRISTEFFLWPIPSAIEFQQTFEAVLIFLALAGVQHQNAHIEVDILPQLLGGRARRFSRIFGLMIISVFYTLITWQAYHLAARSIRVGEASPGRIDFPLYPFKILVFLGMLFALLEALRQLAHAMAVRSMPEQAVED